ncbi:FHA domain-containing protein, partial [Roseomonas eburnea]
MELTLTVLRCPDSVVPEQRRVPGGDYVIGRGADASWVLPDPDRLLSKHHCVLEFRGGGWQVRDLSTNGTFVNHADTPVGRDQVKMLEDGDRLRLGAYEIEVRVEQAGAQPGGWGGGMPAATPPGGAWDQPAATPPGGAWDQPAATPPGGGWEQPAAPSWAAGPAAPAAPPAWGAQDQAWGAPPQRDEPLQPRLPGDPFLGARPPAAGTPGLPSGSGLPADFDPFAEGPAMPDHRPSTSDAFLPPKPMQQVSVIPDSWDLGPTPAAPAAPSPPAPAGGGGRIPDDWNFDLAAAPAAPP